MSSSVQLDSGEDADRFALRYAGVEDLPTFPGAGSWGSQPWLEIAEGEDALLWRGSFPRRAPRPPEGGVEAVAVQRLGAAPPVFMIWVCTFGAVGKEGPNAFAHAFFIDVHHQVEPEFRRHLRRETVSSPGISRSCRHGGRERGGGAG